MEKEEEVVEKQPEEGEAMEEEEEVVAPTCGVASSSLVERMLQTDRRSSKRPAPADPRCADKNMFTPTLTRTQSRR